MSESYRIRKVSGQKSPTDPIFSAANPLIGPEAVSRWLDSAAQPVAVTGGTGFVGSHLVDTLCAAGVRPRVLVRDPKSPRWIGACPVDWVKGGLENRDSLNLLVQGAGTVVHLAGVLRGANEAEFMAGNREGTASLVRAIREGAPTARLVHVSSQAAIGPSATLDGVLPSTGAKPVSAYGRSKLGAEEEIRGFSEGDWAILRPPAIYGPRDTDIFEFFRLASRGVIGVPSGERWITVAYVRDVVRAVLAVAAVGGHGKTYHVGEVSPMKMEDMVQTIADEGGVSARVVRIPPWLLRAAGSGASVLRYLGLHRIPLSRDKAEEILARHWVLNTSDSLDSLGLDEVTLFREGVKSAWDWYRRAGWLR
ncbi:MAG: NAD-dependent epimerase/dehydratase family protein [Thermoanaerobaculales bacterium]|nr:NAD-dependent epimerase/dehydratase family protein [Thermoanaerobaculales bacterium]